MGNVGTEIDLPILERLSNDADPMIAEHADWAVKEVRRRCGEDNADIANNADTTEKRTHVNAGNGVG